MYGTVARMRLKPGMEAHMLAFNEQENALGIPGYLAMYVYRMDQDANEYYMVVARKDAYHANANSPDQHQRYLRVLEMLAGEPEWHDGEIVDMWPRPHSRHSQRSLSVRRCLA